MATVTPKVFGSSTARGMYPARSAREMVGLQDRGGEFLDRDTSLVVELPRTLAASLCGTVEQFVGILWLGATWPQPEHPSPPSPHPSHRRRQVQEESSSRSDGVVPHALDGKDADLCSDHRSQLSRVLQHFVVARHEAREPQLVDGNHKSTVIEFWQPLIDSPQGNQVDLGDEFVKAAEYRLGEVVVEWNIQSCRRL